VEVEKGGKKIKGLIYSDLYQTPKNFKKKFAGAKKFPTFASRFGRKRGERKGRLI
jgi:hypothetical protein